MQVRVCFAAMMLLFALQFPPAQAKPAKVEVSEHAPGGLDPKDTPQFILWSHDDEVNKEASEYVLKISRKRQNPNGCDIPITWFACTSPNCGFSCDEALHLHDLGHELATHTVTHAGLRWLERGAIEEEVGGAKDELVRCGLPADEVAGFRTPYLADKPEVREVLAELGFRYDSTIGVRGGPSKPWPATMESGVPFDCGNSGNDCDGGESYPGMWEVPLYVTKSGNLMDPCTYEGDGSDRPGCSVYKKLVETFDEAYGGNRAPVTVGVHKPWMSKSHHSKDLGKFLDYALAHPNVWVVTHAQLLDWMEAPVPASKMKRFMDKYTCSS